MEKYRVSHLPAFDNLVALKSLRVGDKVKGGKILLDLLA